MDTMTEKTPLLAVARPKAPAPAPAPSKPTVAGCCAWSGAFVLALCSLFMPVFFFQLGVVILPSYFDQDMAVHLQRVERVVESETVERGSNYVYMCGTGLCPAEELAEVDHLVLANEKLVDDMIIVVVLFTAISSACVVVVDELVKHKFMFLAVLWCCSVAMSGGMCIASMIVLKARCLGLNEWSDMLDDTASFGRCEIVGTAQALIVGVLSVVFVTWTLSNVSKNVAVVATVAAMRNGGSEDESDEEDDEYPDYKSTLVWDEPPTYNDAVVLAVGE